MIRKLLILLLIIGAATSAKAQLSSLHYLPPLKQATDGIAVDQQAIYISTPETTAFTVNMYQGTSNTPTVFSVVKGASITHNLADGDNDVTMVTNDNTGIVLANSGLRFESPGGERFYVNYRGVNNAQAASLTSKGIAALGQSFKWGGVPNIGSYNQRASSLGIMATEDNTTVNIFGYDTDCVFRLGADRDGITDDQITITLDAGESYVLEAHASETTANESGWLGASITSDKNIAISNGGLTVQSISSNGGRDAGIDQPVPESILGSEYLVVRGNGTDATEFVSIIAVFDNTDIYINSSPNDATATAITTIDAGEFYIVTGDNFTGQTAGDNMVINTTQDAYVYQNISGSSATNTSGLNFIAPLHCEMEDLMDNIPNITDVAGTTLNGGITIIASTTTPDANIVVTDGNGIVPDSKKKILTATGNTDWKTIFIDDLDGDVSVNSTGPIAVGFFGNNGVRGVAGYFAGFDNIPVIELTIVGPGGCYPGSSVAEVSSNFDAFQWYFDGQIIPGANASIYSATEAGIFYCVGTKGPCTYDSDEIFVYYCDPDVIINKTVDQPEIVEGETAIFTIDIQNFGVDPITGVVVKDQIPAGLTFVSATTINGTWDLGNWEWNIGTINGGETATIVIEVTGDEIDTDVLVDINNIASYTLNETEDPQREDTPSARITVHNDFDNDGVVDLYDVDDDNDGVYDADECSSTICFEPIVNESFELPVISTSTYAFKDESLVSGWLTTATDSRIELWSTGFKGVDSYDGNQFAELNATQSSALYQDLCLTPGTTMNWSLRHRGRNGVDEMQLRIGSSLATAPVIATMSDDNVVWGLYSGTYLVPAGQTNTVFIFEAVSTAGGVLASGNFIDDIIISVGAVQSCADNDGDGYPDNIDLDSDDDGCTDANEYYKDQDADGGDGGEYGTGTPAVNADGSVIAAAYVAVVAPEIMLGNTSQDLSNTDINGQSVSSTTTFQYVLSFQNTGDDDATNYTIRDVLPANVTFDNVSLIDAASTPAITYTYDAATNTLDFVIPDNLVEVGDPEYKIRIQVSVSGNCSDYLSACSSTLENSAFSTYEGVLNTNTFSDDGTNNAIGGCTTYIPEVATNTVLGDPACDVARAVELCLASDTLIAGTGFDSYQWVLDTNADGIADASETVIQDSALNTLVINTIGEYLVIKTSSTCPDGTERISVTASGATQINPVITYFNQVNSDTNTDNDIQGTIETCAVDGSSLPEIFLCGLTDEVTLQLGITDATGIFWDKLDETSCSAADVDCPNYNATCTWDELSTGNTYTLDESGQFRIRIVYAGGCTSRFYFNVFKNNLDFEPALATDITCNTPGSIRIQNVGSGYAFQLIDDATNAAVVGQEWAVNNGPDFDITTAGTYKVQIAAVDNNGVIIPESCVFETEAIGIAERIYEVIASTTKANCNTAGTITVQALNVSPQYTYQLLQDDGVTIFSPSITKTDNTHTFSSVPSGTYYVVATTQDGCINNPLLEVIVEDTPTLALDAIVSQNITCASGIITVTPSGGLPDASSNYQMAIWSYNGADLYADVASIPTADWQTTTSFLIKDGIDAGDYVFIVKDENDCTAFSPIQSIIDLGSPVISTTLSTYTPITCAGDSNATLTVSVSGGTTLYEYSIDGGVTYQSTNSFVGLPAGTVTITVKDSSNNGATGCIVSQDITIEEPFRLTASASIIEEASCNTAGTGALVKIVNTNGGEAPYEYSFDGGTTFSAIIEQNLLPGNYNLAVKDALGCEYPIELTVPSDTTAPSFGQDITYDCDGVATVTITPSNSTDYSYTYALNGLSSLPASNNVISPVAVGTQTITVEYSTVILPSQSALIIEDFGTGVNTAIAEIGSGYCFDAQDFTITTGCQAPNGVIVSGEYAVTSLAENSSTSFRSPNERSGVTDARFLLIDVTADVTGDAGILWSRTGVEVLAGQDINISLWAYNLMMAGSNGDNPQITIELVDAAGTVIDFITPAEIAQNNDADDWTAIDESLNPGTNTVVDIVFRNNVASTTGNDLIIDDILISQLPETCPTTATIIVDIEDDKDFSENVLAANEPSCNLGSDGSIRFEVLNFDPTVGFEYSVNGDPAITSMVAEVTTAATLAAGTHTIVITKLPTTLACSKTFTVDLSEPAAIVPTLSQTADYTCLNTGGTLEASATGGTASYEYQLEDTAGTVIRAYQTSTTFINVPDGDYLVRVQDANQCDILLPVADLVTIDAPEAITFDLTPTACYSGASNGSIIVDVTAGNEDYLYRITKTGGATSVAGAWLTDASTPNTYTFTGLTEGTYDIEVDDAFGCGIVLQTIIINAELTSFPSLQSDLTCTADAVIDLNPTGGSGTYIFEWSNTNSGPWSTTGFTANTFETATAGDYYFRIADTTTPTVCTLIALNAITVAVAETPVISSITPTDLSCNGDNTGSLVVDIDTAIGLAAYTINVLNTTTGFDYGDQTTSLAAGNYTITVTDSKNCFVTQTTTIDEPLVITPNITKTDLTCSTAGTQLGTITVDASGGTADYTYRVNNVNFSVNDTYDTASGNNDYTFTNLDFGDYQVTITDSNNCETIETVTITTGPDVLLTTSGTSGCTLGSGEMLVEALASNGTLGTGDFYFAIFPAPVFSATDPAWSEENPALDNTYLFTGLNPGVEYTFVVHDINTQCEYIQKATVPVSSTSNLITAIDNVTPITCNGFADGIVDFTISGYDATTVDYEIFTSVTNITTGITGTLTGAAGGPQSDTVNNLAPGEFYILFTETNGINTGCVNASGSFIIEQAPTLLAATANATKNQNCNELGSITASGNFGVAPYQYQFLANTAAAPSAASTAWSNTTVANVAAGNYIVYILDANSCVQSTTVTVGFDIAPEIDTITVVDLCAINGSYEVEVTLTTPDTASYNLSVNGGSLSSANFVNGVYTVTGLNESANVQTISIQDVNGCGNTENFEISSKFQATAILTTKVLDCSLSPNPEISITAFDGYGPFEYEITGPVSQALTAIPSPANTVIWDGSTPAVTVTPGTYTVAVYDTGAPGCSAITTIIEIEAAVVPDFTETHVNAVCNGGLGSISLAQVNNGITPLIYEISPNLGTFNATSQTYEDLPVNTYTITAKGINSCETDLTVQITEPTIISFTANPTVTPFGCATGNSTDNAVISIDVNNIDGGSKIYSRYEFIDDATGNSLQDGTNTDYIYTNSSAVDVDVRVIAYDDNGCSGDTMVTILAYDELISAAVVIDDLISCITNTETIRIDVDGQLTDYNTGTNPGNYEFVQLLPAGSPTAQTSNVFAGLVQGEYTFAVTNTTTGCQTTVTHSVKDPNTFSIDVAVIADIICEGDDASIELTISDATYTGDFTWTILDSTGATADSGTVTGVGTVPAINVAAGNYTMVVVQDGLPNCDQEFGFSITTPTVIDIAPIVSSNVSCTNDQGTAEVTITGGEGPYEITITTNSSSIPIPSVTVDSGYLFQGLSEGTYTVVVTDALSCTRTFTNHFELKMPAAASAQLLTVTQLECQGDVTGAISITMDTRTNADGTALAAADTPVYSYTLITYADDAVTEFTRSVSQTSPDFTNLSAGFYSIEVEDNLSCPYASETVQIIDPEQLRGVLVLASELDCNNDASFELTLEGGTGDYYYSPVGSTATPVNTTNTTETIPGITPGTYQYLVTDSNSCTAVLTNEVTIEQPTPLTIAVDVDASITTVYCAGNTTGYIEVSAAGAFGEYFYSLLSTTGATIEGPQSSGIFANLGADTYTVQVTSRVNCIETVDVTIDEVPALDVTATPTDITCFGEEDGTITFDITTGTGTAPFQYAISRIGATSSSLQQFFDDNIFENLEGGTYVAIIQDSKGCSFYASGILVNEPTQLTILDIESTPEICQGEENGTITVTPDGGTAPYSTAYGTDINSVSDSDYVQDELLIEGLAAGDYWVFVKDANNCTTQDFITVTAGANLNAEIEVIYECTSDTPTNYVTISFEDETARDDVLFGLNTSTASSLTDVVDFTNLNAGDNYLYMLHINGCEKTINFTVEDFEPLDMTLDQLGINEITATVTGGTENGYTYYIDGQLNGEDNTFYVTRTDTYQIKVIDENGCEVIEEYYVEFIDIEIPNFFTPDGDGLNDTWAPINTSQFPDIFIKIFDRYGRVVHTMQDNQDGWDGLYKNGDLPTGDYWYVIKLNGEDDAREFVGNFTLYR